MSEGLFPKRPKLKVIFRGALVGKAPEIFSCKDMKEFKARETWYRDVYKPDVVEFIHVPGMIQIKDKPQELVGTDLMEGVAIETVFINAPVWAKKEDTVWGQGFEDTWYVAPPDFSEVVKLKHK